MQIAREHKTDKLTARTKIDKFLTNLARLELPKKVKIINPAKTWQDDTLTFSFSFKKGLIAEGVVGQIMVTDTEVTASSELSEFVKEVIGEQKIVKVFDKNFKELFGL